MNILDLPEACIANILSLTTSLDVCRSSAVSKIFNRAANSDSVWNHFFPTDPADFAASAALSTRKQLYLVNHPQLLHDSRLSFWLDRRSGSKYCYMLAARALKIAWEDDQSYWPWTSIPDTRFREVAELIWERWFDITGNINITLLSDDTLYAAYLVFKWIDDSSGFKEPVVASVLLVDTHTVDAQPSMVTLTQNPGNEEGQRRDGWFEAELGHFFKRRGDLGELKMNIEGTERLEGCLIVLGIEIRPMPYLNPTSKLHHLCSLLFVSQCLIHDVPCFNVL